ncbi:hypothetical protein [Grimontia sp. NTOU-MAR1]|uniref:hypothetical protein n=1 Tax=Grimontia sp. NTOU-MAR1 TaxID=3111011 RepID=UPI002DB8CDE9|nr:hypothetical protein [Grimontia sp. NTOU-MAR1]WRV97973.1 hypothetical protein VP504_00610 [Grimontia sp. NTOU-MAR1]
MKFSGIFFILLMFVIFPSKGSDKAIEKNCKYDIDRCFNDLNSRENQQDKLSSVFLYLNNKERLEKYEALSKETLDRLVSLGDRDAIILKGWLMISDSFYRKDPLGAKNLLKSQTWLYQDADALELLAKITFQEFKFSNNLQLLDETYELFEKSENLGSNESKLNKNILLITYGDLHMVQEGILGLKDMASLGGKFSDRYHQYSKLAQERFPDEIEDLARE